MNISNRRHSTSTILMNTPQWRLEDSREIEGMCRRIAAASDWTSFAGWREDAGFRVFHVTTRGEGARHPALDRPKRHCPSSDADAVVGLALHSSAKAIPIRRYLASETRTLAPPAHLLA